MLLHSFALDLLGARLAFGAACIGGSNARGPSQRLVSEEIPCFRDALFQGLLAASVLQNFAGDGSSAVASGLLNPVPCPFDVRRSSGGGTVGRSRSW